MAIVLKKKPAPVQSIAPEPTTAKKVMTFGKKKAEPAEVLTERQTNALIEQGLIPAPPTKTGLVIKKKPTFGAYTKGDRIKITNDLYRWVEYWKPGDTATVIRYNPPVHEAKADGNKWGVLEVRLDIVRDKNRPTCFLHSWEVVPFVEEKAA